MKLEGGGMGTEAGREEDMDNETLKRLVLAPRE